MDEDDVEEEAAGTHDATAAAAAAAEVAISGGPTGMDPSRPQGEGFFQSAGVGCRDAPAGRHRCSWWWLAG
jgi:hypothetical protein